MPYLTDNSDDVKKIQLEEDGVRLLYIHIILRAEQDFFDYRMPRNYAEYVIYSNAEAFLWDQDYVLGFEDDPISLQDICRHLGYSDKQLRDRLNERIKNNEYEIWQSE